MTPNSKQLECPGSQMQIMLEESAKIGFLIFIDKTNNILYTDIPYISTGDLYYTYVLP